MTGSTEKRIHDTQVAGGSKPRNFLNWFKPWDQGIGMWAWFIQRMTGLFLVLYLFAHFGVLSTLLIDPTGQLFDTLTISMNTPFLHGLPEIGPFPLDKATSFGFIVDFVLIGAMIYHGFNGIRVTMFDFYPESVRAQKRIFWILTILGILTWIIAMLLILIVPEIVLPGG